MHRFLSRVALAVSLGLAVPAAADEPPPPEDNPELLFEQSLETFMRALDALIRAIPQYEMPEITEDGDIIIRRKNPPPFGPDEPAPEPAPDQGLGEDDGETDI